MAKSIAKKDESPSKLIDARIMELGDWRGETLAKVRRLIKEADPEVIEEWKWVKPTNPGLQSGPTTAASAQGKPTRVQSSSLSSRVLRWMTPHTCSTSLGLLGAPSTYMKTRR
jgi:hypothetical protein